MPRKISNSEVADDFDVPETVSQVELPATPNRNDAAPTASSQDATLVETEQSNNGELPAGLRESFDLLRAVEAQAATTRQDEEMKTVRLERIKRHIFQLQQMPVVTLTSENMHHAFRHQDAKAKAEKLKVLAREHPEVAALIEENKKLREARAIKK